MTSAANTSTVQRISATNRPAENETVDAPYSIETVQQQWSLEHEEMGSKTKFWYRRPGRKTAWLFKFPHVDTGEHWAEKIAAEIANVIGIPHAETRLAICGGVKGSTSKSFVRSRQQLFHGNQEMAGALDLYDPKQKFHQAHHTLKNIFTTLEKGFLKESGRVVAKARIADYLVLDALIGNTDRHHENWGVLVRPAKNFYLGDVAPSFDHASSLGRELRDTGERRTRQWLLEEGQAGRYSERARGGVYWSPDEKHAPSPLELVRRGAREFPQEFGGALGRIHGLDVGRLRNCVDRVPSDWMSDFAKRFAVELMCYNLAELRVLLE